MLLQILRIGKRNEACILAKAPLFDAAQSRLCCAVSPGLGGSVMSDKTSREIPPTRAGGKRAVRLEAALKANLKKRKEQARTRAAQAPTSGRDDEQA